MALPIKKLGSDVAKGFLGVFFDIDDTFTTGGRIPACAFNALWKLKGCGMKVVPITGRPGGWCDHIARMWPVDGVVGENGAFYFWLDEKEKKLKKTFLDSEKVRDDNRKRLRHIGKEILAEVPGTAIASDQLYREADLAVDYCEDVDPLNPTDVEDICRIFRRHGATCKVSSIHVNGWFGSYDKLGMTKMFVRERWKMELDDSREHFLFCGDSPNDEPMFEYFPHSAGVRNVLHFADQMKYLPEFVTGLDGGEGFAEIMEVILERRSDRDGWPAA
ncbi:MAG: HAD-IIB family hydrolase [Thermodesulfobacteriota bacterium]|nr:HAD-IIB family hydrolase [Thermodesulfobacteriota bacterium]